MKAIAVIFAGGSGARMGAGTPKQFLEVNNKPIIIHTIEIFENSSNISEIYVVCKNEYINRLHMLLDKYSITKVSSVISGGENALQSIYKGLQEASKQNDNAIVLIHDGVRPFISESLINEVIRETEENGSAITCARIYETPLISKNGSNIESLPNRGDCYTAQAPQTFYLADIKKAYEEVMSHNPKLEGINDSCSIMHQTGRTVSMIIGNRGNIKVTTPEDLYILRGMLQYKEAQEAMGLTIEEATEQLKK